MYEHVERYLVGALNDWGLEFWRLAIGRSAELGHPFDRVLGHMAQTYLRHFGMPGKPPAERSEDAPLR